MPKRRWQEPNASGGPTAGGRMKHQVTGAVLAVGTAMAISALPAVPAAAAISGSETVSGTIVTSGASGTSTVIKTVIVAKGVFDGVGQIAPVPSLPTDPPNVNRVDLIYPVGTMHLVATTVGFTSSVNPTTCRFTATIQQTAVVTGGTGLFANASGDFTQTINAEGLQARNSDGGCSATQPALQEVDKIAASGTLSF